MFAMIQAGSMGVPFTSTLGYAGTDILERRPDDFKIIENPFIYGHRSTQGFIESVWTRLVKRIPIMEHAAYATGFAGLYTSTPDRHPIMDQMDGIEGLYLCTGFSGHGFKLAPAAGAAMAELVLEGNASSIDISPLRLSRFLSRPRSNPGKRTAAGYGANVVV